MDEHLPSLDLTQFKMAPTANWLKKINKATAEIILQILS